VALVFRRADAQAMMTSSPSMPRTSRAPSFPVLFLCLTQRLECSLAPLKDMHFSGLGGIRMEEGQVWGMAPGGEGGAGHQGATGGPVSII
jgi:hypothetical protein